MMEYRRRRPPLYRLARYLRWSSILALILVVLFLISTFYSAVRFATHLDVTVPRNGGYSFGYARGEGFTAAFQVNLTNDGYYPLVLDLSTLVNTAQGPLLPYATTGEVTFPPGNVTTTFGLTLRLPEATLAAHGAHLLLYDTPLAANVWVNGTYAWIYKFGVTLAANATWGAPFANLTVRPGTPTSSGGETTVPLTVNFTDDAFFPDAGNLTFQVVNGGADCGPPAALLLSTPAHQNFTGEVNLTGPSSCMVPGATVEVTYTLDTLTFALPPVRLG